MLKKLSLIAIVSVIALFNLKGEIVETYSTPTGSFGVQDAAYGDLMANRYNISIGAGKRVSLALTYDVELDYDFVRVYETDNQFNVLSEVAVYTGKGTIIFNSDNTNGNLVVRFSSDPNTSYGDGLKGFLVNYSEVVPSAPVILPLSLFPTDGNPVLINGISTDPILTVFDPSYKSMWDYNTHTADLSKSLILLKSGTTNQLGLSADKLCSNQPFLFTSSGKMSFWSSSITFSSRRNPNALVINEDGNLSINNSENNSALVNAKVNGKQWESYMAFLSSSKEYGVGIGNGGGALGSSWFPSISGKTKDAAPGLYFNAQQNGGSTGGTLPGGNAILVFDGRWNNGLAPAKQPVVEFRSGWNNRLAYVNGEGSFYVKKDIVVPGTITAAEVKVTVAPTADFVFEKDYNLRSLAEVDSFILTNKHLPDVPSASKMVEEGVDLAEMNKILLQKIEELTLYVINQEKRIKELEKK